MTLPYFALARKELLPASLQTPKVHVKRLGEESGEEAEAAIAAYAEEGSD